MSLSPTSIEVACPQGHSFRVKSKYAGQRGKCPKCQAIVDVPLSQETRGNLDLAVETLDNRPSQSAAKAAGIPEAKTSSLGRFRILATLGEGAFGTVYRAHDPQLDREVAIKVPRMGALVSEKDVERFLRESRAAAQLRHPNIVPIYDAGQSNGTHYIASAFIPPGRTLRDRIREEKKLDPKTAAQLIERVALALHYAHTQGIVHRDVKPDNVLLDMAQVPHVADFGLARREAGDALLTQEGTRMGTPAYMSPEQHRGQNSLVDARSDQWSLGVMLYEMLTGARPFQGDHMQLLHAVTKNEPASLRSHDSSIPRDLETICLKCLAKDPAGRYATCEQLAEDLIRWRRSEPITARRIHPVERLWRWSRRNPVIAGQIAAVMLVTFVGFVAGFSMWGLAEANRLRAENNLGEASRQREEASRQEQEAQKQQQAAETNLQEAVQQRERAEKREAELQIALADVQSQRKRAEEASRQALQREQEAEQQKQIAEESLAKMQAAQSVAEVATTEADVAKATAGKEQERAEQAERLTRAQAYAMKLRAATSAIENRQFENAEQLLNEAVPPKGEFDFRGFEWRYLMYRARTKKYGGAILADVNSRLLSTHTFVALKFIDVETVNTSTPRLQAICRRRYDDSGTKLAVVSWPVNQDSQQSRIPEFSELNSWASVVVSTPKVLSESLFPAGSDQITRNVRSPSKSQTAVNNPTAIRTRLWDLRTGTLRSLEFVVADATTHAFFNSQETHLVAVSKPSEQRVVIANWNLAAQSVESTWELPSQLVPAFDWKIRLLPGALSPDRLAVHSGNQLFIFDIVSGAILHVIDAAGSPVGSSIEDGVSPDGKHLVLGDTTLRVVNVETGDTTATLNCEVRNPGSVGQCLVTDRGRTIVVIDRDNSAATLVSSSDRGIRCFDPFTGVEKYSFGDRHAERFAFSRDGTMMATAINDPNRKEPHVLLRFVHPIEVKQ
jgi:hypothetical protein